RPGAPRGLHGGQRSRCNPGARPAAWQGSQHPWRQWLYRCRVAPGAGRLRGTIFHYHQALADNGHRRCPAAQTVPMLGALQGEPTWEGGASVPGGEAAVRLHEGALSRLGKERSTGADAVCVVEPVDGTTTVVAA